MAQVPANRGAQGGRMVPRRENPLNQLRRDFDTLFSMILGGAHPLSRMPFDQDLEPLRVWDFDVKETDKEIVVRAELPGFSENELDVQLDNDMLTIKAEKEQKGDSQEEYRSFYRAVVLPSGINPDEVKASYQNGVLELHIPRREGTQPKRIKVEGKPTASSQQGQASSSAPAAEKTQKK